MVQDDNRVAYVAVPESGSGPGVLVLHAWWGLNDFFKRLCDRLAAEGFIAAAPDLYDGQVASTIDEAKQLSSTLNFDQSKAKVLAGVDYLRSHAAVQGEQLGAIGFSMGGSWALELSSLRPEVVAAVVVFYGAGDADFTQARAAYLGHFVEGDEWEPDEYVKQMETDMRAAGREVTFHVYSNVKHWFMEDDRPEYNPQTADLAWQRTLDFLHTRLRS